VPSDRLYAAEPDKFLSLFRGWLGEARGHGIRQAAARELRGLLDELVPDVSADAYQSILAAGRWPEPMAAEIHVNQQVIDKVEGTVIQNVSGTVSLGPRAQDLLKLIDAYGGAAADSLRTALREVEDKDAPPTRRRAARDRLMAFLRSAGSVAKDVLEKYLESEVG
jgi:hypothetical protein